MTLAGFAGGRSMCGVTAAGKGEWRMWHDSGRSQGLADRRG